MVNINDKNLRILATICARGGSKGFPKKNIQLLAGKPLIAHTILFLKKWGKFDYMILSTDDVDIAKIGVDYGVSVPFIRPDNLASDNASKFDVIKHALKFMEQKERITFDLVIDLDPTAPLREQYFLDESLDLFLQRKPNTLFSVTKAKKNPYFNMVELDDDNYAFISKKPEYIVYGRQAAKSVYELNASIYIYSREYLLNGSHVISDKSIVYEMPEAYSVDIDRKIDLKLIEFYIKEEVVSFGY